MDQGTLYLVGTPIGNLSDMSERALKTLQEVDLIAAEDTRTSGLLLSRFGIKKPMISYHKYNEEERSPELIEKLAGGVNIALVTDAGMPAISDPGQILVKKCHDAAIKVSAVPGPCAFVTALAMSGLDSRRFAFEGFLPTDKKEKQVVLERLKNCPYTTVFYEAPHHLKQTLKDLESSAGARACALVRELTKMFEECIRGTVSEMAAYYTQNEPRGEFVILVEGISEKEQEENERARFHGLSLEEHMALYAELSEKEAMKRVAKDLGVSKRDIYARLLNEKSKR